MARARRGERALALLVLLLLAVALLPLVAALPEPAGALRLDRATVALDGAAPRPVTLPHRWPRAMPPGPAAAEYRMAFAWHGDPARPQALLVPPSRVQLRLFLNGRALAAERAAAWADPITRVAMLAPIPPGGLRAGSNVLTIRQERRGGPRPGYLSPLYLGDAATLTPAYRLRAFLGDQLRVMVLGLHLLLLVGSAALALLRPQDRIFGWFALAGASSLVAGLLELSPAGAIGPDWQNKLSLLPPIVTATAAFGLALAAIGARTPRWLWVLLPGLPACQLLAYAAGVPFAVVAALTGLVAMVLIVAACVLLARDYWRTGRRENGALAAGWAIFVWIAALDVASAAGLADRGFLLLPYAAPIMVLFLAAIFLRRLATATNRLDAANETLQQRLAEREAELGRAHRQERALLTEITREQERQRLMRDLHDGLSGHIASIIALAERSDAHDIEQAAREALDDLRLVIHSLDIGSEDFLVVLAYFRERTMPVFRRLGVACHWSMDRIPEIGGVTPGNALAVLRILQEAVTNAIRHGPARRIAIEGGARDDGWAVIAVENDGRRVAPGEAAQGNGLRNMRYRAAALGGTVTLEPTERGMRLTLAFPPELPVGG